MEVEPTGVEGVFVVRTPRFADARGHFQRAWDGEAMAALGLDGRLSQASLSFNTARHTLRGMHVQAAPHGEAKLVRCVRGAIYDVALDLRPASRTFRQHVGVELSAENGRALYIPEGCAHGFLTLTENAEVLYCISGAYAPDFAGGVRWDDPAFGIAWPARPAVIHERDASYPDWSPAT